MERVTSELAALGEMARQRKKQKEDIANNEQMLRLKEEQLNNLKTIHV